MATVCLLIEGEQVVTVSKLVSVSCCGEFLKYLGDADFQGWAAYQRGRLVSLVDAQCTKAYGNAERVTGSALWTQHPGWRPGMDCVPSSPGWISAGGLADRGTLETTDVMGKGSACCCIVVYCAGLRALSCLSSVLWVRDFGLGQHGASGDTGCKPIQMTSQDSGSVPLSMLQSPNPAAKH